MNSNNENTEPSENAVVARLQIAWQDHHHARDQSWKGLQVVVVAFAAMIGLDLSSEIGPDTVAIAGVATVLLALSGMAITKHHRNSTQVREFSFINNMQRFLGLEREDLLVPEEIYEPEKMKTLDILNPLKNHTVLFMMRAYFAMAAISIAVVISQYT